MRTQHNYTLPRIKIISEKAYFRTTIFWWWWWGEEMEGMRTRLLNLTLQELSGNTSCIVSQTSWSRSLLIKIKQQVAKHWFNFFNYQTSYWFGSQISSLHLVYRSVIWGRVGILLFFFKTSVTIENKDFCSVALNKLCKVVFLAYEEVIWIIKAHIYNYIDLNRCA